MESTRPIGWESEPTRPAALELTVLAGPGAGRTERFERARVVIGRGESADLRLEDPTVSLFHVELQPGARAVGVVDLGSRNGTRVGAVSLLRGTVPSGAELTVGSTTVRVTLEGALAVPRATTPSFGALRGITPVMRELFAILERLARTELSVVITGETGTGKELAARAIHDASPRRAGPFVVVDCGALPPTLAQSALFGHERGAFTGATERRAGAFEAASGGTLLLDEVGELPAEIQVMLLGVLQRREVVPVGSNRPRPVDVRVLSATWRDLRRLVNDNTFRQDLYYRVAQAVVRMPSLSERAGDVPFLAQGFLAALPPGVAAARHIDEGVLESLIARPWQGNVRELRAVVERLAMLSDGDTVNAATLAFDRVLESARGPSVEAPVSAPGGETAGPYKEAKQTVVDAFEASYLRALMARAGGNLSRAAMAAQLQRHSLRDLLKKHGLTADQQT
jgi:DNA-binding NtrC family response regulator